MLEAFRFKEGNESRASRTQGITSNALPGELRKPWLAKESEGKRELQVQCLAGTFQGGSRAVQVPELSTGGTKLCLCAVETVLIWSADLGEESPWQVT